MLVDAEHAFDPAYSKALGVDVENLIVCQPDHGEMALESNDYIFFFALYMVVLKTWNVLLHVYSNRNSRFFFFKFFFL